MSWRSPVFVNGFRNAGPGDEEEKRLELPFFDGGFEPQTAYRLWEVERNMGSGLLELRAVGRSTSWPARRPIHAVCLHSGAFIHANGQFEDPPPEHPAPHASCDCGVWAFRHRDSLTVPWLSYAIRPQPSLHIRPRPIPAPSFNNSQPPIVPLQLEQFEAFMGERMKPVATFALGEVALWGRLVECERGWRAEYAYPQRLNLITLERDPEKLAGELADAYGIPVTVNEDLPEEIRITFASLGGMEFFDADELVVGGSSQYNQQLIRLRAQLLPHLAAGSFPGGNLAYSTTLAGQMTAVQMQVGELRARLRRRVRWTGAMIGGLCGLAIVQLAIGTIDAFTGRTFQAVSTLALALVAAVSAVMLRRVNRKTMRVLNETI